MASTSTTILTWEEFERLPDGDGFHRELIEGELQILPPPKSGHTIIAHRVHSNMQPLSRFGKVFLEAGYKLGTSPASWVQPDVSFLRQERVHGTDDDGYFMGGPDLAVEVISPSESATDIQRKVELMLSTGTKAVWVVYPKTRTVQVYAADGTSFARRIGDVLSAPFLLEGWEFPVAKLFED